MFNSFVSKEGTLDEHSKVVDRRKTFIYMRGLCIMKSFSDSRISFRIKRRSLSFFPKKGTNKIITPFRNDVSFGIYFKGVEFDDYFIHSISKAHFLHVSTGDIFV